MQHQSRKCNAKVEFSLNKVIMAQIIWSTRCLVKVLLGIQQKFYQTSSRAIFLLLDVQQIFTPSKRRLVGSYYSATRHLVKNFYQTSSTKSSTRGLVEQKIWAIVMIEIFEFNSSLLCTFIRISLCYKNHQNSMHIFLDFNNFFAHFQSKY